MYRKNHYVDVMDSKTRKIKKSLGPFSEAKAGEVFDFENNKSRKGVFVRIRINPNEE